MTSTIAIAGTRPPDGDDVERLRHPASTSLSFATQCVCRTTKTVRHPHRGMLKLPARVPHLARFPRITRIDMTTRRRAPQIASVVCALRWSMLNPLEIT
jgi:hypothetical protein